MLTTYCSACQPFLIKASFVTSIQWLNSGGTGRNGVPPPLFGVPPPKIAVPLPKVVVLLPGDAVPSP